MNTFWDNAASWVQAFGTIAAVIGTAWIASGQARAAERRAEEARISAKTAALNLAMMAHNHVCQLRLLLRDEARRARLNHISPSRTFLAHQQMLIGFPIESLEDPDAMVAFAFFPSALAMAADLYGHLEEAVRAVEEDDPVEIFTHYADQMAVIEDMLAERLSSLKSALKLRDGIGAGHGAELLRPQRHVSRKLSRSGRARTAGSGL